MSEPTAMKTENFSSFAEFYPYYLAEHANVTCRVLHYTGTLSALTILIWALVSGHYLWMLAAPVSGYALAWVGHFFFEHNKPATFRYPLWSFMGDWVMLKDFLTGRLAAKMPKQGN